MGRVYGVLCQKQYVLLFFIKSFLTQEAVVAEEVSRFALCLSRGVE
jgi:hypothetical protein